MKKKPARSALRKNSDLARAAALSEKFHGRPARKVRDIEELVKSRIELADLGSMVSLDVIPLGKNQRRQTIEFARGTRLACSPDGGQLYFVGGDQMIDLKALGLDYQLPKDHVTIGPATVIEYHTSKAFHDFEPTNYVHEFAEEGGEEPILGFDTINQRLYLIGGSYQVRPEGIVN